MIKQEYQILFQENKLLKERINSIEKRKIIKKTVKKRQETDSEEEEEQDEEDKMECEPEGIREVTLKQIQL